MIGYGFGMSRMSRLSSPMSLLGKDDPPPFEMFNMSGITPLLLVCDHASRLVPAALRGLGLQTDILDCHIAYDIGAEEVSRNLSEKLDAPLVLAGYSRLLIDLNRPPDHPESILTVSDEIPIPGNKNLDDNAKRHRVRDLFEPYHDAINGALANISGANKKSALLSVHSFSPDFGGYPRPWDIGILWNSDSRIAFPLMELLNRKGLNVGNNEPYSGHDLAYTIDRHGGAAGLPSCAVEINQNQLRDEIGIKRWSNVLAEALTEILKGLD